MFVKLLLISLICLSFNALAKNCSLPKNITHLVKKKSLKQNTDIRKNKKALDSLCVHQIGFKENKYKWRFALITNPYKRKGPFWYLPHDNENSAFSAAVYATKKYGGGFLAVIADNKRSFMGQDPNRNFGKSKKTAKTCRQQKFPAPIYSRNVFKIIDSFRRSKMPYLALHNNKNGWRGNDGKGNISMLKPSTIVKAYPARDIISGKKKGLRDEDSMVYVAGIKKSPNKSELNQLHDRDLNVKYEVISKKNNDCSMSNYVVLTKGTTNYYNIETEHNDLGTHKLMIDRLMKLARGNTASLLGLAGKKLEYAVVIEGDVAGGSDGDKQTIYVLDTRKKGFHPLHRQKLKWQTDDSQKSKTVARYLKAIPPSFRSKLGTVVTDPDLQYFNGPAISHTGPKATYTLKKRCRSKNTRIKVELALHRRREVSSVRAYHSSSATDSKPYLCKPDKIPACSKVVRLVDGEKKKVWKCPNKSTPDIKGKNVNCGGMASMIQLEARLKGGSVVLGRRALVEPSALIRRKNSNRRVSLKGLNVSGANVLQVPHGILVLGGFTDSTRLNGTWFPTATVLTGKPCKK